MVEKIVSNLRDFRDIVLAAQSLVNEQFNANAKLLGAPEKKKSLFNQKLKTFQETVKNSTFLSDVEKKSFADLKPGTTYEKAREIILQLTRQEIKSPLA
jgi:hypothetical protein